MGMGKPCQGRTVAPAIWLAGLGTAEDLQQDNCDDRE
jgi:hypothetical protein